jgi:hypothetical protein
LGDRLTLAIYDASCSQPLTVEAEVIRDDDDRGAAMRFVDPSNDVVAQIERMVAGLPSVEVGGASEDEEAESVVVAQILTRRVVA